MYIEQIVSFNPATKEEIGRVTVSTKEEIHNIVSNAREAFANWSSLSFAQRGECLVRLANEIDANTEEIARLITMEMGKPLKDARGEVTKTVKFLNFFAENTQRYMETTNINDTGDKEARIVYEPIGVVAAIKPWNIPLQTPIWGIAPALMTGCVVVLKPSENTLLVAKKLEELVEKCKFPEGVFSFVYGGKDTGKMLLEEKIDMVSFTGSVAAGKDVARIVADRFIKTSLELGGKDALIVMPDANLDFAAMAGVWGSTTNCGQYCSTIQRIYVQESIYDIFVEKVVELTRKIKVGNGLTPDIDMGPVVNQQQFDIVLNQIKDAVAKGAKILFGGYPYLEGELSKGYFIEPTVMVDVNHDMEIMKKETFGPVVRIMKFNNVDEAINLVNDSEFGLGSAVITQDSKLAEYIASKLDVGMVWINEPLISMASCPWIARKSSGIGYELGELGVKEFVKPKLISSQYTENDKNRAWWYR